MCSVWCPKKKSCGQLPEWPFEPSFTEQIPKMLEDNSEHFRAFWKTLFESEQAKEIPKIYCRPKVWGLFLRNEQQFIPWQLHFYTWLNLYIKVIALFSYKILMGKFTQKFIIQFCIETSQKKFIDNSYSFLWLTITGCTPYHLSL